MACLGLQSSPFTFVGSCISVRIYSVSSYEGGTVLGTLFFASALGLLDIIL